MKPWTDFLKKILTSDVDYQNACWLKKEITQKYGKNEAVSGPKECGPDPDPSGKFILVDVFVDGCFENPKPLFW